MSKKYEKLVDEINKQEEVKEEIVNLDNELRLLKQTISDLQGNILKIEKAYKDGTDIVNAINAAVTRAESTVLKVEMSHECMNAIKLEIEELIKEGSNLLSNHRSMMIQQIRTLNEEMKSFIKSGKGVYLSPKVFWWWAGISYVTSLHSLWYFLQLITHWLKH